ncbi:hypothetical protein ACN47E_006291 [Coniothyrium glycines]
MSTNAPYYTRQVTDATQHANAVLAQPVPENDEYDFSTSATLALPPSQLQPSLHAEYPNRHLSTERVLEDNHNFEELLEAATTAAAGQVAQDMTTVDGSRHDAPAQARPKRKRAPKSSLQADDAAEVISSAKRRRLDDLTDPQLQNEDHDMNTDDVQPTTEFLTVDARAAGVHSAAALFRRTSERMSRKYTRPPMSKLFMSLQLTPENFLQLQAQAKAYMLDTAHPERQNCVGSRGKGDTDMVKLRLFNCVRDFLSNQVGEQFFGENVEKQGERDAIEAARALGEDKALVAEDRLNWPRDGNKIISLVTPLMRRMVTNERQRQYAIETRKGGSKRRDGDGSTELALTSPTAVLTTVPSMPTDHQDQVVEQASSLPEVNASALEPSISKPSITPQPSPKLTNINIFLTFTPQSARSALKLDETRITTDSTTQHLAWYEWTELRRTIDSLVDKAHAKYPDLRKQTANASTACSSQSPVGGANENNDLQNLAVAANALQQTDPDPCVETQDDNPDKAHFTIKSLCSAGWKYIQDEQDWYAVLREKAFAIWDDGVCNVLVELRLLEVK